jgi:hypothetical protein
MLEAFRRTLSAPTSLISVTLLLAASTCLGQSKRGDVITNIPFSFTVANRALPPGRYIISPNGETDLRIYAPKSQGVLVPTHSVQGKAPESVGKVIFHRYGDAYFLSQVWVAANHTGRQIFPSRAEKESATKGKQPGDCSTAHCSMTSSGLPNGIKDGSPRRPLPTSLVTHRAR